LMLEGGAIPSIFKTVNFGVGDNVYNQFTSLRKFQPTGPLMCTEYWDGWFDHWGETHHTTPVNETVEGVDQILAFSASVNMYMYHGGTNFGFMNGANIGSVYEPTVTSYDYDAPLNESGDPTPKFFAMKAVISKYIDVPEENPVVSPKGDYGSVTMTQIAPLFDNLDNIGTMYQKPSPMTMEMLDQDYGFILYRTTLFGPLSDRGVNLQDLHDRALIYQDGEFQGILERANSSETVTLQTINNGDILDVLIENMGRVNFGNYLVDYKGVTQGIRLDYQFLFNWTIYTLPMNDLTNLDFETLEKDPTFPAFFRTTFTISTETILDTFVQLPGWTKGVVWVNGINLGRYWEIGPQYYLYLPAPFLQQGSNEIIVLELEGFKYPVVEFNAIIQIPESSV